MKLRLLGGPVEEEFPYLVITDGVTEALWRAQEAQVAWFKEPENVNRRVAYGRALMDWGRLTRNNDAQTFATTLIGAG